MDVLVSHSVAAALRDWPFVNLQLLDRPLQRILWIGRPRRRVNTVSQLQRYERPLLVIEYLTHISHLGSPVSKL